MRTDSPSAVSRGKLSLRGAAKAALLRLPDPPQRILLATSAGAPFARDVIERVIELATPARASITVLSVARVYGTSFGFPNPGLQPNRVEMEQNRSAVNEAAKILRRKGFDVKIAMSKSRNAPKMIARWGIAKHFHAIVVPDPARPAWRRAIEGDLARDIERRSGIPVHAVPTAAPGASST